MAERMFYTWSNVDGEVCIYSSWSDLLDNENWEYLANYNDSLDLFLAGELIPITSEDKSKSKEKTYYKDHYGKVHEYHLDVNHGEVEQLYYGTILVECIPSQAEEEASKIKL